MSCFVGLVSGKFKFMVPQKKTVIILGLNLFPRIVLKCGWVSSLGIIPHKFYGLKMPWQKANIWGIHGKYFQLRKISKNAGKMKPDEI